MKPTLKDLETIEEIKFSREDGLQLLIRHPLLITLTAETVHLFDESNAVNYVEYTMETEKYGKMQLIIQKCEGETPAMQNDRLKKKIAELEAQIQVLEDEIYSCQGNANDEL